MEQIKELKNIRKGNWCLFINKTNKDKIIFVRVSFINVSAEYWDEDYTYDFYQKTFLKETDIDFVYVSRNWEVYKLNKKEIIKYKNLVVVDNI